MHQNAHLQHSSPRSLNASNNAIEIALMLVVTAVFLFRVLVAAPLWNKVVPYTSEGGAFFYKFHLATYLELAVLLLALFGRPFILRNGDIPLFKALLRHAGLLICLVVYLVLVRRMSATGLVIDTYLMACLAGILLLTLQPESRRFVGTAMVLALMASATIGILESMTHRRLIAFTEGEPYFRAAALAGHPLALGAQCVVTIGFITLTRWPVWVRAAAVLLVFIGCVASGARTALILSAFEILLLLMFVRWPQLSLRHERQAKLWAMLLVMAGGAVMIIALFAGGFLNRFGNSIVDANFMARVDIYRIFGFVSWKDIMTGMDATQLLRTVNKELKLPYIESAPVLIILQVGLPAAIAFTVIIIRFFASLLRGSHAGAKIAIAMFIIVNLSNNAFATKTSDILLLTVLLVAFRPVQPVAGRSAGERTG